MNGAVELNQAGYSTRGYARPLWTAAPQSYGSLWRGDVWLAALGWNLVGYAVLGKGWAYVGLPPIFIGEVLLLLGAIVLFTTPQWQRVLTLSPVWGLLALNVWGAVRTIPYASAYGIDALRDAMIWGYSAFAMIVAALILADPSRLVILLNRFRSFAYAFVIAIPIVWLVTKLLDVPSWPWADVPIAKIKGGDALVHLAGVLAFWAAGLAGRVRLRWILLLCPTLVLVGVSNRAGLLTFLLVLTLCLAFRPRNAPSWRLIATLLAALLIAGVTNFRLELYARDRAVSVDQIVTNVISTVSNSSAGDLDGTKAWRLNWWGDIVDYTVNGKYFWMGKGFGINLADDDGYQGSEWEGRLRSPHNGHMTMLARAGVPGVALWVLVQLSWAIGMLHRHYQARAAADARWAAVFLFLFCYWVAFMANTSFDVFIEGPMGGIWLWTLYGVGLAAMWLYKVDPALLEGHESPARS